VPRFVYDNLTHEQLRIGIALAHVEEEITEALEVAAAQAINDALAPFGLNNAALITGGAAGGARAQTMKSGSSSKRPAEAKRVQRPGHVKGATISAGQLASRQLQGRYLAAIRSVPKYRRKQYKAIAQDPKLGRQAAVDAIYRDYPKKGE